MENHHILIDVLPSAQYTREDFSRFDNIDIESIPRYEKYYGFDKFTQWIQNKHSHDHNLVFIINGKELLMCELFDFLNLSNKGIIYFNNDNNKVYLLLNGSQKPLELIIKNK